MKPRTGIELKKAFEPIMQPGERLLVMVIPSNTSPTEPVSASFFIDDLSHGEINQIINHLSLIMYPSLLKKPLNLN